MGRIQKKKTSEAKKKKKQKLDLKSTAKVNGSIGSAAARAAQTEDIVKDTKKKQALPQSKHSAASSPTAAKSKDGILNKSTQFLREVKIELKKVTWPSRKQTLGSTAVVIALVMLISFFLGLVDMGLSNLIRIVLQ
jgi:preprotein translocase subunit SecE